MVPVSKDEHFAGFHISQFFGRDEFQSLTDLNLTELPRNLLRPQGTSSKASLLEHRALVDSW